METRALSVMRDDVRRQADVRGMTARHPDADLNRYINTAIRDLRGLVTTRGCPYFLTATTATTLVGTRVAGEDYSSVPFPAAASQIHGVDVNQGTSTSPDWRQLEPIAWVQRRSQRYRQDTPAFFAIVSLPPSASTPGELALFPYATTGEYKIWYLPDFVDLSADGATFSGLPSWHGWIIQCCCYWLAQEDDEPEAARAAAEERARLSELVIAGLSPIQSAGPLRPRRAEASGYRRFRR